MFNVGFKELIDKCEEYFGKGVTKIAVAAIGLAIVVFAVGFAVTNSIYPLAQWIGGLVTGSPELNTARNGITTAVTVIWVVVMVAAVLTAFQFRRELIDVVGQRDRAERAITNVETFQGKLRAVLAEHPDDAGPHVLKMLDQLTVPEGVAEAEAAAKATIRASRKKKA